MWFLLKIKIPDLISIIFHQKQIDFFVFGLDDTKITAVCLVLESLCNGAAGCFVYKV